MNTEPDDDALIAAALAGDEACAAQLYHRHADRAHRICYRVTLDEGLARDCAQETWLKAFRSLERYRPGNGFGGWLAAIAVRTAIDATRKRARAPISSLDADNCAEPVASEPCARTLLDERLAMEQVEEALRTLSPAQRAAFVMRHYEDAPLSEIAQALGCAEGTVKSHIHRAVLALRDKLAPYLVPGGR